MPTMTGLAYRVLAATNDHLIAPQAGGVVVAPLWAAPLAEDALPGQRLGLRGTHANVCQAQANSKAQQVRLVNHHAVKRHLLTYMLITPPLTEAP